MLVGQGLFLYNVLMTAIHKRTVAPAPAPGEGLAEPLAATT